MLVQTRKPGGLGGLDALDRFGEHALALNGLVVRWLPCRRGARSRRSGSWAESRSSFLPREHAVGAQVDVLLALENLGHQLFDPWIDHRLAAADAHARRAALVDGRQAFVDRQLVLDGAGVFANPPAAGAGQVAGVQRLEHQHQRKFLFAGQLLLQQVTGHRARERKRKAHLEMLPLVACRDASTRHSGYAGRGTVDKGVRPTSSPAAHRPTTAARPAAESRSDSSGIAGKTPAGKPVPVNSGSSHVPSSRCLRSR